MAFTGVISQKGKCIMPKAEKKETLRTGMGEGLCRAQTKKVHQYVPTLSRIICTSEVKLGPKWCTSTLNSAWYLHIHRWSFLFVFFFPWIEDFWKLQEAVAEVLLFCVPGHGGMERHHLFQQSHRGPQMLGLRQDPTAALNSVNCYRPRNYFTKHTKTHSLLSWLQSAQKVVGIHKYLRCAGEGQHL